MKILARILALFLIMPVVELALLVKLAEWIDFWPTIGLILFTGILGGYLAKREGLSVWRQFNERIQQAGLPGKELLDGVIILCAGALLITPGVLTDGVGFLGLIPFTRALIRKEVMRRVNRAVQRGAVQMSFGTFGGDAVMDAPVEASPADAPWQGTARPSPRHTAEGPEDTSPPRHNPRADG